MGETKSMTLTISNIPKEKLNACWKKAIDVYAQRVGVIIKQVDLINIDFDALSDVESEIVKDLLLVILVEAISQ